jgi:hypothetical protein
MTTGSKKKTQVHAQSSNVRTSFTADPEHGKISFLIKVEQLGVVDGSDTKLSLDSTDKWRALEDGTAQLFQSSSDLLFAIDALMET